ncbi:MAG: IPT/TIG domain-containing protein [Catenulispora sp.]
MSTPTLTTINPNQGPAAGGTSVTLTGTALTTTTAVKFGTTNAASFTVLSDTTVVATAPAGSGAVQVTVVASGGTSNGLTYTYRAVPTLTSLTPNQGTVAGGTSVTLAGTHFVSATAVKFGGVAATSFTVVSDTQITAVAPAGTAGPVTATVTTVGGTSTDTVYYYYIAVPTISGVAPIQGPAAGGTSITLTGAHFVTATAVKFGSTAATSFTVVSDTQITAVAPAGTAGPVTVTVIAIGGTSNGITYTYLPAPTLTNLVPNQGPTSGGTSVTLTGTGLTTTTAVTFGSTAATSFTVISDTTVVAGAPVGSGSVQVTATTAGGTSNGRTYTAVSAPGI